MAASGSCRAAGSSTPAIRGAAGSGPRRRSPAEGGSRPSDRGRTRARRHVPRTHRPRLVIRPRSAARRRAAAHRLGDRPIAAIRSGCRACVDRELGKTCFASFARGRRAGERRDAGADRLRDRCRRSRPLAAGRLWIGTDAGEVRRAEWSGACCIPRGAAARVADAGPRLVRGARLRLGAARGSPGPPVGGHAARPRTDRTGPATCRGSASRRGCPAPISPASRATRMAASGSRTTAA